MILTIGTLETLGARLKASRRRRSVSQVEAARIIGVTAATISSMESGRHEPRMSTIVAVLRWLETEG